MSGVSTTSWNMNILDLAKTWNNLPKRCAGLISRLAKFDVDIVAGDPYVFHHKNHNPGNAPREGKSSCILD